ncbi:FG-GAP repeat protein [Nannocystis punicea]|uniref:FG-GAP repeat protein n=1 Tax=Nannocystis punicea TaxID=2995304 RepID=A0ABY7HB15_9BACT|nr:FG-GAP repeat protein [Nannocystis poenicansa]WAS96446.1 FG-GAP repeat protein [Nannocystis poenicansa]
MSLRARLYPLLTLCTLGCPPPAESGDAPSTTDDATSDSSSSTFAEEPTITGSILTTSTEEPTTGSSSDGESTSTGDEAGAPPAAPTLVLDYAPIKQYNFSWEPVAGAEYYQLLERPYPEVPGWSQLGDDLIGTSTTLTMPIHLRLSAAYALRACNQDGCSQSEPVEVDPGVDEAIGYFKASNAESEDYFGLDLAISADGTTMVVGAPYEDSGALGVNSKQSDNSSPNSGAAYVFVREGDSWKQQAYLKSFNPGEGDQFGEVAISANGDTIAVGARQEDSGATGIGGDPNDNSGTNSGAVYVFERKGGAWSQTAYVKANNTQSLANFGEALALSADGNTLVVGAPSESSAATGVDSNPWQGFVEGSGAAYVYSRTGSGWTHRAYLKATNTGQWDSFGAALALSADGATLAVGAPDEDGKTGGINGDQLDGAASAGAVYMFVLNDGAWSQQAYIKASNPGSPDLFGFTLALTQDGDTLFVGAPMEASAATEIDGDQSNDEAYAAGAVYVFSRLGQTWQQDAYIKAPNADEDDHLGIGLAVSGDGGILVAGAPGEGSGGAGCFADPSDETAPGSGAAHVFTRVDGTWTHRHYFKAPNSRSDSYFGSPIGLTADGTTLVIAAPTETSTATGVDGNQLDMAGSRVGAVYMY